MGYPTLWLELMLEYHLLPLGSQYTPRYLQVPDSKPSQKCVKPTHWMLHSKLCVRICWNF